jgi:hypothetical protein
MLVANESKDRQLVIDKILIGGDTANVATIHSPAYPTLAGTAVTGVNLNRDSNKIADATAIADETGNTQANVISNVYLVAATELQVDVDGAIVLGEHDCLGVDFVTDGAAAYVTIVGHYRDAE